LEYLFNSIKSYNINLFRLQNSNPFLLFFDSILEIENQITFNNYLAAYKQFISIYKIKSASNIEKKESLENLVECLFKLLPNFEIIEKNLVSEAEEIDLIVHVNSYDPMNADILEDILGYTFLVECRNLVDKVDAKQIRDFAGKLKTKNIKSGIIITSQGITGNSQDRAGRRIIRDYANQGHIIIVLDKNDLESVSQKISPLWIIRRAYTRMYFKNLKN